MMTHELSLDLRAHERAEQLTADCFFNSLLRERQELSILASPAFLAVTSGCREALKIPASEEGEYCALWVPVRKASLLGRHRYAWPLYLERAEGEFVRAPFSIWVPWAIRNLALAWGLAREAGEIFGQRVVESCEAIAATLEARATFIAENMSEDLNFATAEQGLVVGHSFHPTPRSRGGWSEAERARYSPEMGASFALHWLLVKPEALIEKVSAAWSKESSFAALARFDPEVAAALQPFEEQGFRGIPMHPWQAMHLAQFPAVQELKERGLLIDLGPLGSPWQPTSSLRSLYSDTAPFMLKFSLSVRLTNSVRNLLPHEVERGLQVHEVFATAAGQDLLRRYPRFSLIFEPAFVALKDQDGSILKESIVVTRENPFQRGEGPEALVLATLTEDDPFGRGTWIGRQVQRRSRKRGEDLLAVTRSWFRLYCERILEPILMAQADYGILLGAHQQNILVGFEEDLPAQLYFRDCQGTGYTHLGYELLSPEVSSLSLDNGNVLSSEKGNALVSYYLIINATFNVIYALAEAGGLGEDELLDNLRDFLQSLRAQKPRDSYCLDALLEQEFILHKGNFYCSLSGLNENTARDPLAIYTKIANPLYREGTWS